MIGWISGDLERSLVDLARLDKLTAHDDVMQLRKRRGGGGRTVEGRVRWTRGTRGVVSGLRRDADLRRKKAGTRFYAI